MPQIYQKMEVIEGKIQGRVEQLKSYKMYHGDWI